MVMLEQSARMILTDSGGIGTLIGMEIPLIIRILRAREDSLRLTVANVMTVDYVGALVAALAFPFLLVPHLGLMRAAFVAGLLNLGVAWVGLRVFKGEVAHGPRLRGAVQFAALLLACGIVFSGELVSFLEERVYPDEIIYAKQTPYQRIVITRWRDDTRLFLDRNLQFSSKDEYRYHESLVHPALGLVRRRSRVLILGGGDGMAARECLKYPDLRRIDLVDIDPEMTRIFTEEPLLAELNDYALRSERVHVVNQDAMKYLEKTDRVYDVILMDLPDPSLLGLGKLYSRSFFSLAAHRLHPHGILAVQSSSPYFSANAFWCIVNTLASVPVSHDGEAAQLHVRPYHATVPSFGLWGFVLTSPEPLDLDRLRLAVPTRFLSQDMLAGLFVFPADLQPRQTEINRLDNQILVQYYTEGYDEFYE
jgi:spermidine synthase